MNKINLPVEAEEGAWSRFQIITGGPGSGKSTLIEALASAGFPAMPEAGRSIIQDQVRIGGPALPWADRQAFAELMLAWELRSYREALSLETAGPVFFDRGAPDVIGYLRLCGLEVPGHVLAAAREFSYGRRVFLAPPWRDIFHEDQERKQSWAEAEATCRAMVEIYTELGYELVELPPVPVDERVEFILEQLKSEGINI